MLAQAEGMGDKTQRASIYYTRFLAQLQVAENKENNKVGTKNVRRIFFVLQRLQV